MSEQHTEQNANMDDFFNDSFSREEYAVKPKLELPLAFVQNPRDPTGPFGLFIPGTSLPEGVAFSERFKEVQLPRADKQAPGGFRMQQGFLAQEYRLVVLAVDHDDKGQPRAWKSSHKVDVTEDNPTGVEWRWHIYAVCQIVDAWSPSIPFMVKFGGVTNAFRAEDHFKNADVHIVYAATRLREENAKATGAPFRPACRYEFLIPFKHKVELVGQGSKQSYVAAIQDYVEGACTRNKYGRGKGTSVLEYYSRNDERKSIDKLRKLLVMSLPDGRKKLETILEQVELFKDSVKLVDVSAQFEGANGQEKAAGGKSHFTEDADDQATERQLGEIGRLGALIDKDPNHIVQFLRAEGQLLGGDEDQTIFSLNRDGASMVITYLTERAKKEAKAVTAT